MKHFLLALLAAATAAHARDYAFKDRPFEEGDFSTDGKAFIIHTISSGGNFCDLGGLMKHNVYRDGKGCEVRFAFARNKVSITVPESAREACAEYCGHNAHFADQYHRLPAACTRSAAKNTAQRFHAAYRARNYAQAARIQQQYVNACNRFMVITEQMRARNDLAVAYKNSGNKTACRTALKPLRRYWNDKAEEHGYHYRDYFMKALAAAKFNWNACRR